MKRTLLALLTVAAIACQPARAQVVNLTASAPGASQNFDAMAATTALPTGWRMAASTSSPAYSTAATVVTQQASSGAPTQGGTYNFGTTGGTDRAVGAISSGGFGSPNNLLVELKNNDGSATLTGLTVGYQAERYRINTAAASVAFYYSTDGTAWTAVTAGDIAASNFPTGTNAYTFGSPLTVTRSGVSVSPLSILPGSSVYLRWNINTTGTNSQGIGIDDVSITGTFTTPSTPSLSASPSPLTGFGYIAGSGPSASQSFSLSGTNLTGAPNNVTVTAPAGYEVSTSAGSGYGPATTVAYSSATLSATSVYARLAAGNASGNYAGDITFSGGGAATPPTVGLTGRVYSPAISPATSSLTGFSYAVGSGPSTAQSVSIAGSDLWPASGTVNVTAPTNYEVRIGSGTWGTTASFTYSANAFTSTSVGVRLASGLAVGSYSGTANISGGASATITASGSVLPNGTTDATYVSASAATTISSINNAIIAVSSDGTQVAAFNIREGGSGGDTDALPTNLTQVRLSQGAGNQVDDWATAIQSIALFDGATKLADGVVATGPNTVTFNPATPLAVPDNGTKQLTVRLTLKTAFNAGSVGNVDGDDFVFTVNQTGLTANTSGSAIAASFTASTPNGSNAIAVVATKLTFTTQPSDVSVNDPMTPEVVVAATDVNGNVDADFTGTVTVASSGTLQSAGSTASAASGEATFVNLVHTATATARQLTATATGLPAATSAVFNVLAIAGTTLKPGDLFLIGYDNSAAAGGIDKLSMITLVPLAVGTQVTLANVVYEAYAPANVRTNRWYSSSASPAGNVYTCKIKNTGTLIPAGSVICISYNNLVSASNITVNGAAHTFTVTNSANGIALSTSAPDGIFLMQGSFSQIDGNSDGDYTDAGNVDYATFSGSVLSGLQDGGTWYTLAEDMSAHTGDTRRISRVHPQIECTKVQGRTTIGQGFAHYNTTAPHSGTRAQLLTAIVDFGANWTSGAGTTGDDIPNGVCSGAFTVAATTAPSNFTGNATGDAANWFNCANWDTQAVPDDSTDVEIGAGKTATVDDDASFASFYTYAANARNLTLSGGTLQMTSAGADVLNVHGNLAINSGTFNGLAGTLKLKGNLSIGATGTTMSAGTGTVLLNGSSAQTLTNGNAALNPLFHNLTISNASGIVLGSDISVGNQAAFMNGVVNAGSNRLVFNTTATASGASAASYVDGKARKVFATTGGSFTFPTGNAGKYAPATLAGLSTAGAFDVQYFGNGFSALGPLDSPLVHVSGLEYWNIDRTTGTPSADVTLYWDAASSVDPGEDLRIAHWNGSSWESLDGTVAGGSSAAGGAITVNGVSSFSPFTFGSNDFGQTLPVELIAFDAQRIGSDHRLTWTVGVEDRLISYAVEESTDGRFFRTADEQPATGVAAYVAWRRNPAPGAHYYRLRMNNADGTRSYSPVKMLVAPQSGTLAAYPNPATDRIVIALPSLTQSGSLMVVNALGQTVLTQTVAPNAAQQSLDVSAWPMGVYTVKVCAGGSELSTRVVKH